MSHHAIVLSEQTATLAMSTAPMNQLWKHERCIDKHSTIVCRFIANLLPSCVIPITLISYLTATVLLKVFRKRLWLFISYCILFSSNCKIEALKTNCVINCNCYIWLWPIVVKTCICLKENVNGCSCYIIHQVCYNTFNFEN